MTNIPSRNRVSSNSSMIGFRGTEDLGGDLKAFFQVESQINADTGTATATTGVLAGRNSGVGLKGGWGSVLMGRWDTPYKIAHVKFDPFRDVTIASDQNVLGQMSTTPSGDFHPRFSNSIQYWTPELAGFSGRLDYSANEGKTDTVNPLGLSGALYYDQGPFYAVLAHERHNDSGVLVAGAGGDDKGTVAGLGFKFDSTKLGLLYERLEYKTQAAGGSNLRRNAWFLSGEHRIGNILLRGYYGNAGDQSGSFTDGPTVVTGADTGAEMHSLGVGYTLSKRTELYASYTRINNESNATYEFGINPTPGLAVTKTGAGRNPGIDPSGFLIGMVHVF